MMDNAAGKPEAGWLEQALRSLFTWERSEDIGQLLDFELRILGKISGVATKRMGMESIFLTSKGKIWNGSCELGGI